jgi:hypothetical protein
LVGFDPHAIPGVDAAMVDTAIAMGEARFAAEGIEADMCLVKPDATARAQVVEYLTRKPYVVVIGGGLRKPDEQVELLEHVIQLIRTHAPQAAIAFNTNPITSADAANRWLVPRA